MYNTIIISLIFFICIILTNAHTHTQRNDDYIPLKSITTQIAIPVKDDQSIDTNSNTNSNANGNKEEQLNTLQDVQASMVPWGDNSIRLMIAVDYIDPVPTYQGLLPITPPCRENTTGSCYGYGIENPNGDVVFGNGNLLLSYTNDVLSISTISGGVQMTSSVLTYGPSTERKSIYPLVESVYSWELKFDFAKESRCYGLGEHRYAPERNESLLYKNWFQLFEQSQIEPNNGDIMIPWIICDNGIGMVWNVAGYGSVNISQNSIHWTSNSSHQLDLYVTTIPMNYSQPTVYPGLMKNFADAVGHPNPLPHVASGFWQSKDRYRSQDEILAAAEGYHSRGLPISVIVLDWFNWALFGDFTFNPACFPDPLKMIQTIEEVYGITFIVSVWPFVASGSTNYNAFNATGAFSTDSTGADKLYSGTGYSYDPFKAIGRAVYGESITKGYSSYGAKHFWLDNDEGTVTPDDEYWNGRSNAQVAPMFPKFHVQAVYEAVHATGVPTTEIFQLSRSAYLGSALYNAVVWSGDIQSTWDSFFTQILVGQNVAMSGIYWWTTDIGGYFNGNTNDPSFQELLVRWFQFGAFCPIFRLHGHRLPELPKDPTCGISGGNNEVWTFTYYEQIADVMWLREKFRPYIEYHLELASINGTPLMRPMFYDFNDEDCYTAQDQYMFGPDWLVAPVYVYQATSRKVYLPTLNTGKWRHYYSNTTYTGGQWIVCDTTLDDFPLFERITNTESTEASEFPFISVF